MQLSDAIRLGAMIRPKMIGFFFLNGASCAQGAALEATGTPYIEDIQLQAFCHDAMRARWPWLNSQETVRCPACGRLMRAATLIPHLNNTEHDWPRERIADFVATCEPPPPVDAVGLSVEGVLIDTAR